jgi:small-conductance mechanosensitive channel
MSWNEVTATAGQALEYKLFVLGGTQVTLKTVLTVAVILIATYLLSWGIRRAVTGVFSRRGLEQDGNVQAIARLTHYGVLLVGLGVALQTAGFNLNAFFAAGAVFAIGIGFALQNLMQNFVSGVILLLERAIKPDDVLEVEGRIVRVARMGIRATIVRTRDGDHMIVPNSVLVQSTVKNYTLKGSVYRVRAKVGVTYGSDMKLVKETLDAVMRGIEWRLRDKEPIVLLTDFGNNSVNFDASIWVLNPWDKPQLLSKLNQAIWWALKDKGIVIAFPQLDVHFDPPVEQGLSQLAVVR